MKRRQRSEQAYKLQDGVTIGILAEVASGLGLPLSTLAHSWLARTAIQAALTSLTTAGVRINTFREKRLRWTRAT